MNAYAAICSAAITTELQSSLIPGGLRPIQSSQTTLHCVPYITVLQSVAVTPRNLKMKVNITT